MRAELANSSNALTALLAAWDKTRSGDEPRVVVISKAFGRLLDAVGGVFVAYLVTRRAMPVLVLVVLVCTVGASVGLGAAAYTGTHPHSRTFHVRQGDSVIVDDLGLYGGLHCAETRSDPKTKPPTPRSFGCTQGPGGNLNVVVTPTRMMITGFKGKILFSVERPRN